MKSMPLRSYITKSGFVRTTSSRSLRAMKDFLVVQSRMAQLCSMQTYTSKMTV
uniref:Uncharacterized protein n=1 Tax=Phage sp. ctqZP6 TaxID=2828010 RepID=A0A8S5SJ97_9VIRU|nr:MAG TPA: hypothetical protein [Phage sp. ctqZP6]